MQQFQPCLPLRVIMRLLWDNLCESVLHIGKCHMNERNIIIDIVPQMGPKEGWNEASITWMALAFSQNWEMTKEIPTSAVVITEPNPHSLMILTNNIAPVVFRVSGVMVQSIMT